MYESFMYDKNGARLVESLKHNNNKKKLQLLTKYTKIAPSS